MDAYHHSAYILNASELTAEQIEAMTAALPRVRREIAACLTTPLKRAESVAAAYLAFFALCGETGQGLLCPAAHSLFESKRRVSALAAETGWTTGGHGKPFPTGVVRNGETLHISISHSGGTVAAAVSGNPIGVDIQRIPRMPKERMLRIASKFHPEEQRKLVLLPESGLAAEFCRLWACKESVMKLCGQGLALPMASFYVRDDRCILDGKPVRISVYELKDAYLAVSEFIG